MQIIEQCVKGKQPNQILCEDGLVITDHIVAVIDGVTAKGSYRWNQKSSGRFAKDILCELIPNLPYDAKPNLFFQELDDALDEALVYEFINGKEQLLPCDYPRASVIVYNDYCHQIWNYGDCRCKINQKAYYHEKEIDILAAKVRAFYLNDALLNGTTEEELLKNDIGRTAILPMLEKQYMFENKLTKFGYPVINGCGICTSFVQTHSVKRGDTVILASDGYPFLCDSLEESERVLQELLKEDPLCFRQNLSTKGLQKGNYSFDDRTYCRIVV